MANATDSAGGIGLTKARADLADRDEHIAALIRTKIKKVEADAERLGYLLGSANDTYMKGQIVGLRLALAFVEPSPQI